MGNTADNLSVSQIAMGPGKLYGNVIGSALGAGGRLLLGTDGSPDSVQNPNAVMLGYTAEGAEFSAKTEYFQGYADEDLYPIVVRPTKEELVISGNLYQILDETLWALLNPTGTRADITGTKGLTFGGPGGAPATYGIALIFPQNENPTLFAGFHLYKAYNDAALAAKITSKAIGQMPFAFRGLSIPTRAAGDRCGRFFKQNAAGS